MKTYRLQVSAAQIEVQLSDEDAKRYGALATPIEAKAAPEPQNKSRTAATKE